MQAAEHNALASPHAQPAAKILEHLRVSLQLGLSGQEAGQRLAAHGPNTIAAPRRVSLLVILIHQVVSPVVYLLAAAAALSLYFGELIEGAAIASVLALNTLIGFTTELQAARSIEGLRALGSHPARVRRSGRITTVPAEDLVPGDIVLVDAGDRISADLRLIEASNLWVDESTLTGESMPVEKSVDAVAIGAKVGDRTSMLFKGTIASRGSGVGIVIATGLGTELGRISHLVEEADPERSPLEKGLAKLSGQLIGAVILLVVVIAAIGLANGKDLRLMIQASIALAVAAIPEGLPVVATLTLARGMRRMARKNALIERLPAVETLGATTVILTDKTGTLTENRMTVRRIVLHSGLKESEADRGAGEFDESVGIDERPERRKLLEIAALCNDATLGERDGESSGDPMELALLRAAAGAGVSRGELKRELPQVRKHAFDTRTRMMATVHREIDGHLFAVKGAPEAVLEHATQILTGSGEATMDAAAREKLHDWIQRLGGQGLRVIACAFKNGPDSNADPYHDLVFVGLIGLEAPPREDVPGAIRDARQAGIRIVMVTGDHGVTARSIARAVGIGDRIAHGGVTEQVGSDAVPFTADIFARVDPAEKLDLVRAYQAKGEVVAMTGDGVNDAPALRQADIGVAMGKRGTDIAREAAAMILLDDAFSTIVEAIREGRVIFANIRRCAAYLLSCNLSEVLVVGVAVMLTLPLPILPLQILYLNLITDVFPAFALAMGEGAEDVMRRPPRNPSEPILGAHQWRTIVAQSTVLTAGTFVAAVLANFWSIDEGAMVTVTFLTLAFAQLWHAFNMADRRSNPARNEVTRNPWAWAALLLCSMLLILPTYISPVAGVLRLVPPNATMWAIILSSSLAPLFVLQLARMLLRPRSDA
ncbi:cation-translocating P-type ATPase [Aminobacter aminovorans]|jgi:Ca2+-transporting ATPase|uniref:Ca2+-transporting ATPase n=1 Tax=Aminobacter aminovorans TaxID=83263 RepID=A0AAC8YV05_AMIAI|nr:cation-transporting P-type ATPase [Aminobacter aminovorans]AMS44973.1 Cation-transporting ATPase [Aminobacter aminovorans]MBB3709773.1 Ca2+-transporting ATPase [Aminobacter aminovorans]